MKFLKLTPNQQIIAVGAGLGIVIVLIIAGLVVPQILKLGSLGVEESKALTQLNAAKSNYAQLEELKKSSRKTESDLLRVDRKAPEDAELPALLIQIEDISTKSGITFMSIKPSEPEQKNDYKEVPLEIQIDGYFFSLLDFIYRLEKIPRVLNITKIDIKEGKQGLPNIEATIKLSAFVMTPGLKSSTGVPATAPAAGAAAAGGTQ